ncbi:MAG: DNA-directed RNA polymerase subunit delta [Mollicutes bacterium]|nr:DNA-directed RNA polymerase subunit delta [Mollicutes bacterium]MDD7263515.1 DNA-directed RNA polymerase subunit delta [bacterium]MDY4979359.1 DNA-directed RNA polymerase subunit delta [Candidatus Onthovivens sp.]
MEKNYKNESMVDVAFDILNENQRTMNFQELYHEITKKLELTDEESLAKIAQFYTNLSLDGRFVTLGNNEWDLRKNQTYDKVHIDMNDVYSDIEEETAANRDVEELDEDVSDEDSDDKDEYDSENKNEDIL